MQLRHVYAGPIDLALDAMGKEKLICLEVLDHLPEGPELVVQREQSDDRLLDPGVRILNPASKPVPGHNRLAVD